MASCALLAPAAIAGQAEPYTQSIAGTTVTFDMVPVANGVVTVSDPGAPRAVEVEPFWIGKTEVTWDELDVWMLGLDVEPAQRAGIDAESRPSRPYGAPDRGFGHAGFAAISVTYESATRYAEWLSEKTGHSYRLPTRAEWQLACLRDLGLEAASPTAGEGAAAGAAEAATPTDTDLEAALNAAREARAWHAGNADGATHAVASKEPGALGLYDMLGNAGEWVTNPDGDNALHGGTYRDDPTALSCATRAEQDRSWNERDPQIPKSSWWLSDGPFAGFRLVRERS